MVTVPVGLPPVWWGRPEVSLPGSRVKGMEPLPSELVPPVLLLEGSRNLKPHS